MGNIDQGIASPLWQTKGGRGRFIICIIRYYSLHDKLHILIIGIDGNVLINPSFNLAASQRRYFKGPFSA